MWSLLAVVVGLIIIAFVVWWAMAGRNNTANNASNKTNTTATSTQPNSSTAAAQVKANWVKFFTASTPVQTRVNLLQNGQQFAQVIQAQASTPTAQATSATVSNVVVKGTTATVTYTINVNGQPALTNQTGQAIYINNIWKVSDTAFCGLLQLSGNVPQNCPAPASSASPTPTPQPQSQQ